MLDLEQHQVKSKTFVHIAVPSRKPFDLESECFPARALRKAILDFRGVKRRLRYYYHSDGMQRLVIYDSLSFIKGGSISDRLKISNDDDEVSKAAYQIKEGIRECKKAALFFRTKRLNDERLSDLVEKLETVPEIENPGRNMAVAVVQGFLSRYVECHFNGHIIEAINLHDVLVGRGKSKPEYPIKQYSMSFY